MHISSAIFDCSAPDLDSCPDESLPEFAFIGRSNVGKSSLLNLLSGKLDLARVSPTPGFTKLINFFTMNKTWRLVDLPGYGFAAGARKAKFKFNHAVDDYLKNRTSLCCVFALLDSGLPPQEIDVRFIAWLARNSVPFVLVFTKTDKVTPATVQANIAAFTARISGWFEKLPTIFTCSAMAKHGREELLGVIDEVMAAIEAESAQTPQDDCDSTRRYGRHGPEDEFSVYPQKASRPRTPLVRVLVDGHQNPCARPSALDGHGLFHQLGFEPGQLAVVEINGFWRGRERGIEVHERDQCAVGGHVVMRQHGADAAGWPQAPVAILFVDLLFQNDPIAKFDQEVRVGIRGDNCPVHHGLVNVQFVEDSFQRFEFGL